MSSSRPVSISVHAVDCDPQHHLVPNSDDTFLNGFRIETLTQWEMLFRRIFLNFLNIFMQPYNYNLN